MNTNQDTTLTNQDGSFNEFIISDDWVVIRAMAENSDELAEGVWQAATKASEQRIKELDSKIQQFIGLTDDQVTKILELQAKVNLLQEALTQLTALKFSTASYIQKLDAVDKIANKALKADHG